MDKVVFFAAIQDGYPFKNLMLMIHSTQSVAHIVATEDGLQFSYYNGNGGSSRNSVIHKEMLKKYKYAADTDMVAYAFNTDQMCTNLKTIVKKMPIYIYKLKSESDNRLYIKSKINPWNEDPPEVSMIDIITEEYMHLDLHTPLLNLESKFIVCVKDFVKMCTKLKDGKCTSLRIQCSDSRMTFEGVHPNNSNLFIKTVIAKDKVPKHLLTNTPGYTTEVETDLDYKIPDKDVVASVSVPIMTVNGLLKWHNVSPANSYLSFYVNAGGAILAKNSVGKYGEDIIYFPREVGYRETAV